MKLSTSLLLLGSLLVLMPVSSQAAIQPMLFFETQVPAACLAEHPNNKGSYIRQYRDTTNPCPGLSVYHIVHGANAYAWSFESFYISNGFLRQMNEIFINENTGAFTFYRAFRDQTTLSKGIPTIPTYIPGTSKFWYAPPYHEEHWTNGSGQPVCFNTQQNWVWGSLNWTQVYDGGTYSGWLQDKRSSSQNPSTWHNVQVVVRVDQWGYGNYEFYHYGRWQNPATGQWQGLGLIKWEKYSGSQLVIATENHYLVDCNVVATCTTCPP